MGMAIAWRNPRPAQTIHRCVKVTAIASADVCAIHEMIRGYSKPIRSAAFYRFPACEPRPIA
jgi:hypothetical protein